MKKLSVASLVSLVIGALLIICGIVLIVCGFAGYSPSVGMQHYSVNGWQMTMMRYDSNWDLRTSSMLSVFMILGVGAIVSGLLLLILSVLLHMDAIIGEDPKRKAPVKAPAHKRPAQLEAPPADASPAPAPAPQEKPEEPGTEPAPSEEAPKAEEEGPDVIHLGPPADHS